MKEALSVSIQRLKNLSPYLIQVITVASIAILIMALWRIAIIALFMLVGVAHADDYEKYCPTVQAIYGICSPELVQNWLAHKDDAYTRPKPPLKVDAKPSGTELGISDNTTLGVPIVPKATPEARTPPCWCRVDDSWACRINETIAVMEPKRSQCTKWRQALIGKWEEELRTDGLYKSMLTSGVLK